MASTRAFDAGQDPFREVRERMVAEQIQARGVSDPRVLAALRAVPRHCFVPEDRRAHAYEDSALMIGEGQTISQPYMVAFMTQELRTATGSRVLEIGTGSGYQAAVLAELGATVYSVELRSALAERAAGVLEALGYEHVRLRRGDGSGGWPEEAPFDGIVVTAAAERVPQALVDQLGDGARLVIPLGAEAQELHVMVRRGAGLQDEAVMAVRFVPFVWRPENR